MRKEMVKDDRGGEKKGFVYFICEEDSVSFHVIASHGKYDNRKSSGIFAGAFHEACREEGIIEEFISGIMSGIGSWGVGPLKEGEPVRLTIWCSYIQNKILDEIRKRFVEKYAFMQGYSPRLEIVVKEFKSVPADLQKIWDIEEAKSLLEERKYADYLAFCQMKGIAVAV